MKGDFKQKILRTFLKHGGEGEYIRIFEHIGMGEQIKIVEPFELMADEIPIIAGLEDRLFFLMTTRRLLQLDQILRTSTDLEEIIHVTATNPEKAKLSVEVWPSLEVTTRDNQKIHFRVEGRKPFFGVWNALLFIAARNKGRAE